MYEWAGRLVTGCIINLALLRPVLVDTWINILTISVCARNMSSHMVRVVLWQIYRFSKYCFHRFHSLSMCSRSYNFVSKITIISMPFLFLIISYRFRGSESNEVFHRSFPTVFIPKQGSSTLAVNKATTTFATSTRTAAEQLVGLRYVFS